MNNDAQWKQLKDDEDWWSPEIGIWRLFWLWWPFLEGGVNRGCAASDDGWPCGWLDSLGRGDLLSVGSQSEDVKGQSLTASLL